MAKKKSPFGAWVLIIGLVVGAAQCVKTPDNKSSRPAQNVASTAQSAPIPKPSVVASQSAPRPIVTPVIETRFVTAASLNVRERPNTAAAIVGKLLKGNQVSVLEISNGWLLIKTASVGPGWVSEQYTSRTRNTPTYSAPLYTPPAPIKSGRYILGPRGGCYYINRNGNKTYVDRSLCR